MRFPEVSQGSRRAQTRRGHSRGTGLGIWGHSLLTDAQCKAAKPAARPYKLAAGRGLYLFVTTTGFKSWRWKYRIDGKEKRLTFGSYPDVKLRAACDLRDEADKLRRQGLDPAIARRQQRAASSRASADTFEAIARQWHARKLPLWSTRHGETVLTSLEAEAFPLIGKLPIRAVTAPLVLEVLAPIEQRGAIDQAHRLRQRLSDVFVFAIAAGFAETDPASMVKKALAPVVKRNYPALTKLADERAALAHSGGQNEARARAEAAGSIRVPSASGALGGRDCAARHATDGGRALSLSEPAPCTPANERKCSVGYVSANDVCGQARS